MGEYIKLNGQSVKLGTCEDLYYATYDQVQNAVNSGAAERQPGNLPPPDYLAAAHGWRYRFPFPDEDNVAIGTHRNFDRGVLFLVTEDFATNLEHETCGGPRVLVPLYGEPEKREKLQVSTPCPFSATGIAAGIKARPFVEIVRQKLIALEGAPGFHLWTVARCPYCGICWRFDKSEAETLCALQNRSDEFVSQICDRILSGYTTEKLF